VVVFEEDIEEYAEYVGITVAEYKRMVKNIYNAAHVARVNINRYERQFEIETLPVEWLRLTTSRFKFDESKAVEMAKEYI